MHTNASWICAGFNTVVFNSMGEGEGGYCREIGSKGRRRGAGWAHPSPSYETDVCEIN